MKRSHSSTKSSSSHRSREFRVLRQDHHSLGRNRNQALAAARGDYILFVDDDNVARPQEIETLLAAAQRTGADAMSCFCEVFADDAVLTEAAPPLAIRPFSGDDVSIGSIHNCLGDANAFFPRRTFETFGKILEEPERGYEDWEYLLRIALCGGRIEVVPDALYWYRGQPGFNDRHFVDGGQQHGCAAPPAVSLPSTGRPNTPPGASRCSPTLPGWSRAPGYGRSTCRPMFG